MMILKNTLQEYGALFSRLTRELPLFPPPIADAPVGFLPSTDLLAGDALPDDPGQIAIVGIVDHVIPFAHRLLTTQSGHSRVAAIWLQDGQPVLDGRDDIAFGRELRGPDIDQLRQTADGGWASEDAVYRGLDLMNPARAGSRWTMRADSHGAGVACTAAGYAPDDPAGRSHPLIAVGLPDWALAGTSGAAMPLLMQVAVTFIISRARLLTRQINDGLAARGCPAVRPPVVINISLGITAGPRDGGSLIEQLQDSIAELPPAELGAVHFVLSTGNTRQRQQNAVLSPGQQIGWRLPPDDLTISEMQIWSPVLPLGAAPLQVRVTLPGTASEPGRSVATAFQAPDMAGAQIAMATDPQGRELARLVLQAFDRDGGMRQCLTIIVPPTASDRNDVLAPPGLWQVSLLPGSPADCDVVIQRDDRLFGFPRAGRQSWLVDADYAPRDPTGGWQGRDPDPPDAMIRRNGTCNAYAWGRHQIRCGAHLAKVPSRTSAYAGLLGSGDCGDLTAAGDRSAVLRGVPAPGLRGAAMQMVSGTSIATPRVTRWLSQRMLVADPPQNRAAVIATARDALQDPTGVPGIDPPVPWDRALSGKSAADH